MIVINFEHFVYISVEITEMEINSDVFRFLDLFRTTHLIISKSLC